MRPSTLLTSLALLLASPLTSAADPQVQAQADQAQTPLQPTQKTFKISIWTQPLTPHALLPSYEKLAKIIYTTPSKNYTLSSYDLPSFLGPNDPSSPSSPPILPATSPVKLGFYSGRVGDEETWHGILSTAEQFGRGRVKTLKLHLDETGKVWSLGFSSVPKTSSLAAKKKTKGKKQDETEEEEKDVLLVETLPVVEAKGPALNKPVVVNKEGKTEVEGEVEKTFLQKYWWAIGLFLLVQIVMGGGGDK